MIPPGSEELRGDEAETIIKFKNALGIDDPDAASMHMEVFFQDLCPYLILNKHIVVLSCCNVIVLNFPACFLLRLVGEFSDKG